MANNKYVTTRYSKCNGTVLTNQRFLLPDTVVYYCPTKFCWLTDINGVGLTGYECEKAGIELRFIDRCKTSESQRNKQNKPKLKISVDDMDTYMYSE